MKKPFIYLLTAGLAVSMLSNTSTVNAETTATPETPGTNNTTTSVNFTGGALSLASVLEPVKFTEDITINNDVMESHSETNLAISMSDFRGTGEGWRLTAMLEPFGGQEKETLKGAYITLNDKRIAASSNSNAEAPQNTETTIINKEANNIVIARSVLDNFEASEGRGTWDFTSGVKLTVPNAMASVGEHSSNIAWTLYNTPE